MQARDDEPLRGNVVERAAEEDAGTGTEEVRRPSRPRSGRGTQRRWWVSDEVADQMERFFAENCSRR